MILIPFYDSGGSLEQKKTCSIPIQHLERTMEALSKGTACCEMEVQSGDHMG